MKRHHPNQAIAHRGILPFNVLVLLWLAFAVSAEAQWIAFNDHAAGSGTHANATRWNVFGTANGAPGNSGPLKNIVTGSALPVTLVISNYGGLPADIQGSAAAGSPAYSVFNGFVDFQGTPSPSVELAGGQVVTYRFTGLNPDKLYSFKGTAIRGSSSYGNRWSLFELAGARSFTSAHSANAYTNGLAPTQVAINTGINNTPQTGDLAFWDNISPSTNGTFEVTSRQYTGTIPGGTANGTKGYALTGIRLEELSPPGPVSIIQHPQNLMAELGGAAVLSVVAAGNPIFYQWQKNNAPIPNATNATLRISPATVGDAGSYSVVVSNAENAVLSSSALLTMIPNWFTRVTTGFIVTDGGYSLGCAWGDYDNDGWLDLYVANDGGHNFLYRNNQAGGFTKITTGAPVTDSPNASGVAWADYDNDGNLDLFVANLYSQNNFLYHNNGDGTFTSMATGSIISDGGFSRGVAWGDYDRDGFLDLLVSNDGDATCFLYHNNRDGTFSRIITNSLVQDSGWLSSAAWADLDNDGDLDAFVANSSGNNYLYRNEGGGIFSRITAGTIVNDGGISRSCAWGDYDNDGFLDLYVCNGSGQNNFLYHNNGDGSFTRITSGAIVNDGGSSTGCAWGDFDNDGYLDLFVCNSSGQNNFLYHNNGDGTFLKITAGPIVNDGGSSHGCAWGDFNNDGFLDLFVSNWAGENNFLYRNNGNTNHWLKLKCTGTRSNRSAIGTKIHLLATIHGQPTWQVREISGGSGFGSQNSLVQHFGLGAANTVDTIRVEWPSGLLQEFSAVAADQLFAVTEPVVEAPRLALSPQNQTVAVGQSALFASAATGTEPLFYQWLVNGSPLPDAQKPQLLIPDVTTNLSGNVYSVIVSNVAGKAISAGAVLTVWGPIQFTQPNTASIQTNGSIQLRLGGLPGTGSISIQVSTNLVDWSELRSVPITEGTIEFTEPVRNDEPARSYRAVVQQ